MYAASYQSLVSTVTDHDSAESGHSRRINATAHSAIASASFRGADCSAQAWFVDRANARLAKRLCVAGFSEAMHGALSAEPVLTADVQPLPDPGPVPPPGSTSRSSPLVRITDSVTAGVEDHERGKPPVLRLCDEPEPGGIRSHHLRSGAVHASPRRAPTRCGPDALPAA